MLPLYDDRLVKGNRLRHNGTVTVTADTVKRENLRVHDNEARWYDRIHREIFNFAEQRRINKDITRIGALVPRGKVLDVGCGSGNLTLQFFAQGFDVTAPDISPEMIRGLEAKMGKGPAAAPGR